MQATMNLSGRQLPPLAPLKRKEREEMFSWLKPAPQKLAKPMPKPVPVRAMAQSKPSKAEAHPSTHGNMLLAGFMAHEFLTNGTLFGKSYEPSRADFPSSASSTDFRTMKMPKLEPSGNKIRLELEPDKNKQYAYVSELLKTGVHIPGIVNPSQLASLLHLHPKDK